MTPKTLPLAALKPMATQIVTDVQAALKLPYAQNELTQEQNFTAALNPRLELQLTLLNDPDYDRHLSFFSDPTKAAAFSGATEGQATVKRGITFLYLTDGYRDSYLTLIKDGKAVQNLKLEQQILAGPEVDDLIDRLLAPVTAPVAKAAGRWA